LDFYYLACIRNVINWNITVIQSESGRSRGTPGVYGITRLGYPIYFLTVLGIWKILGVVAVLIPKFPLLKEWAYAGFFFAMSGAVFAHIASGDSMNEISPSLLLLILTVVSWYFRPPDRKIISVNQ
jgi:DoxX-like family